jgi:hypothetical protein
MKRIRELRPSEITYSLDCEPEDSPISGNLIVSDDPEQDRKDEAAVQSDLDKGNQWAWCYVVVKAHCGQFTGRAGLGGCSYSSEQAFHDEDDYFTMLKTDAVRDLMRVMDEAYLQIQPYLIQESYNG